MSYWLSVTIAGIGLALLILVTHLITGRYFQRRFWKSFAIAHILFIIIASLIYFVGEKDAQHQLFWLIPAVIDLPSSLLVSLLPTRDIIIAVLTLAIVGTLQYAIIGWLIDLAVAKFNKSSILEE
ncbi:MAG: hypothetical protein L0G25_05075 [Psychrobacter sp.]|nr:hypothetical protein [Psychrobacter sp.]